jgi:hypothetical protein
MAGECRDNRAAEQERVVGQFESSRRFATVILSVASSGAKDLLGSIGGFFAAEVRMLRMTPTNGRANTRLTHYPSATRLDLPRAILYHSALPTETDMAA